MLHGVWRKKPTKHNKRRRPMMSGLLKYLATDSHMQAALLSPPSSCDLSTSRKVPFLDTGAKGGDGGGNKRKRCFERAVEYLKSDPHLYGALVDAEGSGSAVTAFYLSRKGADAVDREGGCCGFEGGNCGSQRAGSTVRLKIQAQRGADPRRIGKLRCSDESKY